MRLQVRSSPRHPPVKVPAAKKAKKPRADYPSTNVSSPIRAPKQKKIQQYAYRQDEDSDDDSFAPPRHPIGKQQNARGYVEDDFVVCDNHLDDDFAPVREAKRLKTTKTGKSKGVGAPITNDERLAELNPAQIDTIFKYVEIARDLRSTIMVQKGYRTAIFSDTVIREMGLELPRNLEEMRSIPGIRGEMVDLYGKKFLPLIQKTRQHYGKEVPNRRHLDQDDEEVQDPNHCNVVNLCSSDAEESSIEAEAESDHPFLEDDEDDDDDDDDDYDDDVHISHHFNQQQDPEVAAFNERMSQLGTAVPKATPIGGSKVLGGKKGRGFRKSGSGGGKSHAGVKKRATKASGGRASSGAAKKTTGGQRKGGASGGGWGGIMAMPT